jgi:probable HAF family extracellular repeat protein
MRPFCFMRQLSIIGLLAAGLVSQGVFAQTSYTVTDLGTMGGAVGNVVASGINARGEVVGQFTTSSTSRAFLYAGGRMTDLGTLGGHSVRLPVSTRAARWWGRAPFPATPRNMRSCFRMGR